MPHPTPSGDTGRGDLVCGKELGWLNGERDQQLGVEMRAGKRVARTRIVGMYM
jgi:hypothetical protein